MVAMAGRYAWESLSVARGVGDRETSVDAIARFREHNSSLTGGGWLASLRWFRRCVGTAMPRHCSFSTPGARYTLHAWQTVKPVPVASTATHFSMKISEKAHISGDRTHSRHTGSRAVPDLVRADRRSPAGCGRALHGCIPQPIAAADRFPLFAGPVQILPQFFRRILALEIGA